MASFDNLENVIILAREYFLSGDDGLYGLPFIKGKFSSQNSMKSNPDNSVKCARKAYIFKSNKNITNEIKKKNNNQRVTVVKWKAPNNNDEKAQIYNFEYNNILNQKKSSSSKKSLLSHKIAKQDQSNSKFAQYTRICCETNFSSFSKKLLIYYKISSKQKTISSVNIVANGSAKFEELIGLVFFKIEQSSSNPLAINIKDFDLYMTEDGEPVFDFPPFDKNEIISKFGFDEFFLTNPSVFECLTLRSESSKESKTEKIVVIVQSSNGVSRLKVDSLNCTMENVLKLFLRKRGIKKPENEFYLEKRHNKGSKINLASKLETMGTLEFSIFRQKETENVLQHASSVDSIDFDYKFYQALLVVKFLSNYSVTVGISFDGIHIDPVIEKSVFFNRIKPIHIALSNVSCCSLEENKTENEVTVKIVINKEGNQKTFTLLIDPISAEDLVKRINGFSKYVASNNRFSKFLLNEEKHGLN